MTGHTKGGLRPAPRNPGGVNDRRLRLLLDPHHRPPEPRGSGPKFLSYDHQSDTLAGSQSGLNKHRIVT